MSRVAARWLTWLGAAGLLAALVSLFPLQRARAAQEEGPPHGDLVLDCGDCHREDAWVPVTKPPVFRHEKTGFPLVGAHAGVGCRKCHSTLVFNRIGSSCADCHKEPHRGEMGFRCERCHVPQSWTNTLPMSQAHQRTRFPLVGAHASVDCRACHREQKPFEYVNTPTECYACHSADFARTTRPNHTGAGFSHNCQDCHTPTARTFGSGLQHPAAFPLTGAHASQPCARCHPQGLTRVASACFACHEVNYRRVTNPNHVAAGFPTTCQDCHTTNGWRPASFNHASTRFPLSGAHVRLTCDRCHTNGRYAGTPTDCFACHQAKYNATTNPSHSAGGFPTTCQNCHTTDAWRPASFNHANTRFPLTGLHATLTCDRCHTNGRYAGTPTDCFACHQANYNASSNPSHSAAGFPTTCQDCHTTSGWRPSTFNHDAANFPIYSGRHRTVWSRCSECHVNASNFRVFECILCHQHSNRAQVDSNHSGVSGYSYSSARCYACHPRGVGGD
jgi:hypothetical protein